MAPTSDEQIQFLVNIQRLLGEGQFVAPYKLSCYWRCLPISPWKMGVIPA
jgi:GH25 family lysozyme M1 (1,4-beta-N-acetylmuramidase)